MYEKKRLFYLTLLCVKQYIQSLFPIVITFD